MKARLSHVIIAMGLSAATALSSAAQQPVRRDTVAHTGHAGQPSPAPHTGHAGHSGQSDSTAHAGHAGHTAQGGHAGHTAQGGHAAHGAHASAAANPADSAFAALQNRGQAAMGVDQYTSTHVFEPLADGGRIELQRNEDEAEGVRAIRAHLEDIARLFAAGDFQIPGFVHAQDVPGTRAMADRRAAIAYSFRPLPRGGEVRITTSDPTALAAIHEFLAFQRADHRVH